MCSIIAHFLYTLQYFGMVVFSKIRVGMKSGGSIKSVNTIRSVDGIEDFGHYYVCIRNLVKPLNCSISYLVEQTGLNYRTIEKLIKGEKQRTVENSTIERICYCFQCQPSDFCFYEPPI